MTSCFELTWVSEFPWKEILFLGWGYSSLLDLIPSLKLMTTFLRPWVKTTFSYHYVWQKMWTFPNLVYKQRKSSLAADRMISARQQHWLISLFSFIIFKIIQAHLLPPPPPPPHRSWSVLLGDLWKWRNLSSNINRGSMFLYRVLLRRNVWITP